jgi:hypothetical protein
MPEQGFVEAQPGYADSAAEAVQGWLRTHSRLYLGLCVALCFITFAGYSHVKAPWVDEILQLNVARQNSIHDIWNALKNGVVAEPPVPSTIQHYLIRTFGESMFWMRLPAIFGFTLGCLSLACLAWRYVPAVFAASVFFMPYTTTIRWRAMDARPYGLMFGCTAFALLCWDRIDSEEGNQIVWRGAFVLSLAALLSTHFYAILVLLPLGLGELTRWAQKRRIEWANVACIAVASLTYFIWLPILISVSREYLAGFFYRVDFKNLISFYASIAEGLPLAAALVLILTALLLQRSFVPRAPSGLSALHALASVCIGFLLLPVVGFVAGLLITGVFVPYHYVVAAVGVALGVPLVLAAISGGDRVVGLALFLAIAGYGLLITARGVSGYTRRDVPYPALAEVRKLIPEQQPDIVVPSLFEFLPFQEADRADAQNNLIYLYDAAKARQILKVDSLELIASHLRGITPARLEPFDKYIAVHRRLYIATTDDSMGVWLSAYLTRNMAAQFTWLGVVGRFELNRVDLPDGSRARD